MNRRQFLFNATKTILIAPLGMFLLDCGSDTSNGRNGFGGGYYNPNPYLPGADNTAPAAPPRLDGANIIYTSSQINLHSHSFSVPSVDLVTPPLSGFSGTTTEAQLHSHAVIITQSDFQNAMLGRVVKVQTSVVEDHVHTLTIVRIG